MLGFGKSLEYLVPLVIVFGFRLIVIEEYDNSLIVVGIEDTLKLVKLSLKDRLLSFCSVVIIDEAEFTLGYVPGAILKLLPIILLRRFLIKYGAILKDLGAKNV